MKVTMVLEDRPGGTVGLTLGFDPPVTDQTPSTDAMLVAGWLVSLSRATRNRERERLLHELALFDHQIALICRKLGLSRREALALAKEEG